MRRERGLYYNNIRLNPQFSCIFLSSLLHLDIIFAPLDVITCQGVLLVFTLTLLSCTVYINLILLADIVK